MKRKAVFLLLRRPFCPALLAWADETGSTAPPRRFHCRESPFTASQAHPNGPHCGLRSLLLNTTRNEAAKGFLFPSIRNDRHFFGVSRDTQCFRSTPAAGVQRVNAILPVSSGRNQGGPQHDNHRHTDNASTNLAPEIIVQTLSRKLKFEAHGECATDSETRGLAVHEVSYRCLIAQAPRMRHGAG